MNAIGGAATFATGMGLAASHDNQSVQENTFKSTQQTTLDPMTGEELDLSKATTGLGLSQTEAIKRLLSGSFMLSPEEMAQLNQMYAPSEAALKQFGSELGQDIMGRSGLTGTSTPVTEAVMRQMLPAMAALQQQKMGTGLGLGMQMKGMNLQAAMGMPGASGFNLQKLFNERLATGKTTTSGSTRGTFNPGFLDRLATASGAQKNFTSAGADLAGGSSVGDAIGGAKMVGAMFNSDARLKRDIQPVSWKWKDGDEKEYLGIIAQQVEESHPHLVTRGADGYRRVDYGAMVAMLLNEREHLYAQLAQQEQLT
jgi:hypothetical protein